MRPQSCCSRSAAVAPAAAAFARSAATCKSVSARAICASMMAGAPTSVRASCAAVRAAASAARAWPTAATRDLQVRFPRPGAHLGHLGLRDLHGSRGRLDLRFEQRRIQPRDGLARDDPFALRHLHGPNPAGDRRGDVKRLGLDDAGSNQGSGHARRGRCSSHSAPTRPCPSQFSGARQKYARGAHERRRDHDDEHRATIRVHLRIDHHPEPTNLADPRDENVFQARRNHQHVTHVHACLRERCADRGNPL